ncbi:hypothetical protein C8Q79DRAFT_994850 [Trametes meyenii]|nr:hypothetical protein C8Q79DRAFT_994850 [Trametes meyenii]
MRAYTQTCTLGSWSMGDGTHLVGSAVPRKPRTRTRTHPCPLTAINIHSSSLRQSWCAVGTYHPIPSTSCIHPRHGPYVHRPSKPSSPLLPSHTLASPTPRQAGCTNTNAECNCGLRCTRSRSRSTRRTRARARGCAVLATYGVCNPEKTELTTPLTLPSLNSSQLQHPPPEIERLLVYSPGCAHVATRRGGEAISARPCIRRSSRVSADLLRLRLRLRLLPQLPPGPPTPSLSKRCDRLVDSARKHTRHVSCIDLPPRRGLPCFSREKRCREIVSASNLHIAFSPM